MQRPTTLTNGYGICQSSVTAGMLQRPTYSSLHTQSETYTANITTTETRQTLPNITTTGSQSLTNSGKDGRDVVSTHSAQQTGSGLNRTEANVSVSAVSYNLTGCGETWRQVNISLKENTHGHMFYPRHSPSKTKSCAVVFQALPNKILQLRINECQFMVMVVSEPVKNTWDMFNIGCQYNRSLRPVYTVTAVVAVTVRIIGKGVKQYAGPSFLSLYFSAVNHSERSRLEIITLSSSVGYIQTPGWGRSRHYPPLMLTCVILTPPGHHVMFLSVVSVQIGQGDYLYIIPGQCVSRLELTKVRQNRFRKTPFKKTYQSMSRPSAHIFPDDFFDGPQHDIMPLSFYFFSNDRGQLAGFRLKYSFHFEDTKPRRVEGLNADQETKWNCSTSKWPSLSKHFPCDLVSQCSESEDEAPCPYTTEKCGVNRVEAGKRCFIFKPKKIRSWLQSDQECRHLGGLMANLETAQKWTEVMTLLQHSYEPFFWVGLRATRHNKDKAAVEAMYTDTWQWLSGSVAYYLNLNPIDDAKGCIRLLTKDSTASDFHEMNAWECYSPLPIALLCELPLSSEDHDVRQPATLAVSPATSLSRTPLVTCPLRHVVHKMLACDLESRCGKLNNPGEWYKATCSMAEESPQLYFYCGVQGQYVPYSLVCDHREDCTSGQDEYFCVYPPCKGYVLNCGRGQCVDVEKRCDGRRDCLTNADEENCRATLLTYSPVEPPAVVTFDRPGGFTVTALAEHASPCPETHFLCSAGGYCLPIYVRCNGIIDCPGHEDEVRCSHAMCPGFYRCRGKDRNVCVHVHHLCDGWPQCPQQDDEATCSMACPQQCTCQGLAFTCTTTFSTSSFPQLRYLEARSSGLLQNDTTQNIMLVHLGVQACGWSALTDFKLFNLHSLDLSDNLLRHINFSHFMGMQQLRRLNLARNPISAGFSEDQRKYRQHSLMVFNFSGVRLHSLNLWILSGVLSDLEVLVLSHGGELSLHGQSVFPSLRVLDLTGTFVSQFPPNFMKSMDSLQRVFADSFKLCCQTVLPDIFPGECIAPVDEISSCDDLLKSNVHRLALGVFCVLSILGNFSSCVYRLLSSPRKIQNGFALFVVHLCVSDFLMGLYLAFVGLADRVYAGTYVWSETIWKKSTVCRVAGFLSLLSSEVSAFIICLITIDRFIVLHFPFSQFRFRGTSAHLASAIIWFLGVFLASVPLLPALSYWEFYHQTGICIPLPVSRADFPGHGYSFGVMIVCNFILFLLIALGQSMIYWSVRANTMSDPSAKNTAMDSVQSTETVLARRLLSIAVSDFLCWFPVGLCGLLAGAGILISEKVSVALAIFVLPLNSALNPFIYTLNVVLDKRQKARELRLRKFVHAHLSQHLRGTMTMN